MATNYQALAQVLHDSMLASGIIDEYHEHLSAVPDADVDDFHQRHIAAIQFVNDILGTEYILPMYEQDYKNRKNDPQD